MFIELVILNSLFIIGLHASIQKGNLFYSFLKVIENLPFWIRKPLGTCPTCMASVYGSLFFWGAYEMRFIKFDYLVIMWIVHMLAVAGLNKIIIELIYDTSA